MVSKKEQIVDFALQLIKQKSFSSFSYEDISKKLEITKAAIHYHFEKKEDLGIAVCERLQVYLIKNYEHCLDEIKNYDGHPWSSIDARINTILPDEICPILSLQSDYENLSSGFREKVEELCNSEIYLLKQLVRQYAPNLPSYTTAISVLMGVKGALQYRRVLGEELFIEAISGIKEQFYDSLIREGIS